MHKKINLHGKISKKGSLGEYPSPGVTGAGRQGNPARGSAASGASMCLQICMEIARQGDTKITL